MEHYIETLNPSTLNYSVAEMDLSKLAPKIKEKAQLPFMWDTKKLDFNLLASDDCPNKGRNLSLF